MENEDLISKAFILLRKSLYDDEQKQVIKREILSSDEQSIISIIEDLELNQADPVTMGRYNQGDILRHLDNMI